MPEQKCLENQIQEAKEGLKAFEFQLLQDDKKTLHQKDYQIISLERDLRKEEAEKRRQATVRAKYLKKQGTYEQEGNHNGSS